MRSETMGHKKGLTRNATRMAWALMAIGCLFVAAQASGQTTLYTFNGDSDFDHFGHSVSGAGDVNADGVPDQILCGALGPRLSSSSEGHAASVRVRHLAKGVCP